MKTEIGTRQDLMVDLTRGLAPGAPLALLVVFRLGGYADFVRRHGDEAGDDLIRRAAERISEVLVPAGIYYRPRRDEVCLLVTGPLEGVGDALFLAVAALSEERETTGIGAGFGAALLPNEADDPIGALAIADRRVSGLVERRKPFPRNVPPAPAGRSAAGREAA
jgi:GGDEF domain-containing protein